MALIAVALAENGVDRVLLFALEPSAREVEFVFGKEQEPEQEQYVEINGDDLYRTLFRLSTAQTHITI